MRRSHAFFDTLKASVTMAVSAAHSPLRPVGTTGFCQDLHLCACGTIKVDTGFRDKGTPSTRSPLE